MIRAAAALLLSVACLASTAQDPPHGHQGGATVRGIAREDLKAFSKEPGKLIVGTLPGDTNGHVVLLKPGTDRVFDGNTLGGLKDLLADKKLTSERVENRINNFIKLEFPGEKADIAKAPKEAVEKYLQAYMEKGAPASHSYSAKNGDLAKVEWYQVPSGIRLDDYLKAYKPPANYDQNLRCSDFVRGAAPALKAMVREEVTDNKLGPTANNIDKALKTRAEETTRAEAPPVVRPPEPPAAPVPAAQPMERKTETKPGGIIITAKAQIDGLAPARVRGAAYDPATSTLTLTLDDGSRLAYEVEADLFAVAVKCVIERGQDPVLSMSHAPDRPGYNLVTYVGPLFKTRFGEIMYRTDVLLGAIIFNREGAHRATAAEAIPGFVEMALEANRTMVTGSRVFLRAWQADFAVEGSRLAPGRVRTKVDVEGTKYAAGYYHESLHRLARAMDERFDALAEAHEDFQDFCVLARAVALARWIKTNAIPFDAAALTSRSVAAVDFPAYSPSVHWYSLFNERNLDGWTVSGGSKQLRCSGADGTVTLAATSTEAVEILEDVWSKSYDVKFILSTKGPVELLIRKGEGEQGAAVAVDTKGEARKFELFVENGQWTAVGPAFGKKGALVLPEPKKDEARKPNVVGLRVPQGSEVTILAASLRRR